MHNHAVPQHEGPPIMRFIVAGHNACNGLVASHWNLGHFGWQERFTL